MGLITSKHDAKQGTQVITGSCYQKILGLDIVCLSVLNIQFGFAVNILAITQSGI